METLSMVTCFTGKQITPPSRFLSRTFTSLPHFQKSKPIRAVSEIAEEDVLQAFFEERKLNSDFISKTSDMLWQRAVLKFEDVTDDRFMDTSQGLVDDNDDDGGFLKLSVTQKWISGGNSAPINKKAGNKILSDDRERKKKLNFLKYEALKRELMLLSVGIGTACSGYCLIVFSFQAAISYAVGVLSSCLYLQLLYQHADKLSKDMIPDIFTQKKTKKIGIRSEDIKNVVEKLVKGSGVALSSPRLMIPAAIYALWILSHKFLANDFFDFQLTPAMLGMFVYKAAALVQVYRENENLRLVFPENDGDST
ncbi:uncharacterized protein LOC101208386 [Cucumis sativus]|uniref:CGL160/ATPI domain-containing protein n=1 Tax=Cucumis sativus TaxID=3659 RepID=A0A0A0LVU8_CUCSA|nr:uncharacterized protein LOC101208386 [Cucumis sativus]KGN64952.1 hypothetical protein Csa_022690 [Cucumis sativus]